MYFEVLVEDRSGSLALESILEQILGAHGWVHTWRTPNELSSHVPES